MDDQLYSGSIINLDFLKNYPFLPFTIGRILSYGDDFKRAKSFLYLTIEKIINTDTKVAEVIGDRSNFEGLIFLCSQDSEMMSTMEKSYQILMAADEVKIDTVSKHLVIAKNDTIYKVDEKTYYDLNYFLKYALGDIQKEEVEELKPADEKARKLIEQKKIYEEKLAKAKATKNKSKANSELRYKHADLMVGLNLSSSTVNQMTIHQFGIVYNKMRFKEGFEINVLSTLQGAKNLDLTHWTEKEV